MSVDNGFRRFGAAMWDIVIGLIILFLGAAVCFAGLRVFFVALPVWGFLSGFFAGAIGVHEIFGDGLLQTLTGWLIGLLVGIAFAVLSYLYWYVGALIAAGSIGATIGSGIMDAFGVDDGFFVFLAAGVVAVIAILLALVVNLPVILVIVTTALAGASAVVTGAMLILNRIDRTDLGYGAAWAMIEESWFWLLAWLVIAVLGLSAQFSGPSKADLPEGRWESGGYSTT